MLKRINNKAIGILFSSENKACLCNKVSLSMLIYLLARSKNLSLEMISDRTSKSVITCSSLVKSIKSIIPPTT